MGMELAADFRTILAGGMQLGKIPLPSIINKEIDTNAAAV